MKTITYDGTLYHCPFSEKFPRHTSDEQKRMDECKSFLHPIHVYYDMTLKLKRCVLDGEGRLESASRTGAVIEVITLNDMPYEVAYALAKELNDARRHEGPEAIAARRERVAEARAAGDSLRTIADREQVSEKTVRKDLAASGADRSAPEPETVTGKDGKTYPATRPAPDDTLDAAAEETLPPEDEPDPEPPKPAHRFTPPPDPPPHIFAELMSAVVRLNRLLTTTIGKGTPQAARLKTYLTHARLIEYLPERFIGGKHIEAKTVFLALKGVRRIIDVAGTDETDRSEKDIKMLYDIASGGFVPPVHTRRRTAKKGKGKK